MAQLTSWPMGNTLARVDGEVVGCKEEFSSSAARVLALSDSGDTRALGAMLQGAVDGPDGVWFAGDEATIYAATSKALFAMPTSGGGAPVKIANTAGWLALDGDDVYVSEAGKLTRVPRSGGAPVVVAAFGGGAIVLDGDRAYLLTDALRVERFTWTPQIGDVQTIATLSKGKPGYWWDDARGYRGWIGVNASSVFYWEAEVGEVFTLCHVPKAGGASSCSTQIPSIGPFIAEKDAAYALVDGRLLRVDVATGAVRVLWDGADWRVTGNVWSVPGGVEWLTSRGELLRLEVPCSD